jgi:hypothetical protein
LHLREDDMTEDDDPTHQSMLANPWFWRGLALSAAVWVASGLAVWAWVVR